MGLLDTLLGRTRPARANLDALFALPGAAVTLQAATGLVAGPEAGVCFKPPAGRPFEEIQAEIEELLATADQSTLGAATTGGPATDPEAKREAPVTATSPLAVRHVADRFGYRWIVLGGDGIDDLVTRAHMVHSTLQDAGWGSQLLCSVFDFRPGPPPSDGAEDNPGPKDAETPGGPLFVVYLAKQGTFYPFAPAGHERRDNELELRIRAVLGADLPIERDLSRWFPLWDLPFATPGA